MQNIQVVLVRPRFPENIGMAARACANMGVSHLCLVKPELWDSSPQPPEASVSENSTQSTEPHEHLQAGGAPNLAIAPNELRQLDDNLAPNAAVCPYRAKALSLATSAGRQVINNIRQHPDLSAAIASTTLCLGTTARTGGWRQHILAPEQAARLCAEHISQGGSVSLVFGPEDTGLLNSDVELCTHLVCIPTALEAASLNLAQAVLILLYELRKAFGNSQNLAATPSNKSTTSESSTQNLPPELDFEGLANLAEPQSSPTPETSAQPLRQRGRVRHSPLISLAQKELLTTTIKETMQAIDYLPQENSTYLMLPISRLIGRSAIRHNEFSMLMGICRKTLRLANKQNPKAR